MLDPCIMCRRPDCRLRRVDCLAPYPHLHAIGNSAGGFRATIYALDWTPLEKVFYNAQIHHGYGVQRLPPLL